MFICKDVYCSSLRKCDIEFSDDLLEFLGINGEYINFLYDKYVQYKAKNDSMYTLIGVCLDNIKKNAENKKEQNKNLPLCETYEWMTYSWLFDVPELQQYKKYPDIRWFDACWGYRNYSVHLSPYLNKDLSDYKDKFNFSDKELKKMGVKRGYVDFFLNMLAKASNNKLDFEKKLENNPDNLESQKWLDFWRKREVLMYCVLEEFKNKVDKVSKQKHISRKNTYDWMLSARNFWNMVELRDFKLYQKKYPNRELRL